MKAGKAFELFVKHLLINIGFSEVASDGIYVFDGAPGQMLQGLGEAHNADVLLDPPVQTPLYSPTRLLIECKDYQARIGIVLQTGAFLYIGDVVMATITKKQMEEYERLRRDRDNGRLLTPDGLRLICAAYENDPEKIGIHMLEMLAKFRNEGIID